MPPLIGVAVVACCVAVLALMVLLIPALREAASSAISGDTEALRSELDSAAGVAVLYVLALMHTVIWFPAEILDAAAGYVWGFGLGMVVIMGAWMLNCWAAWEVGHRAARPLLYRLIGRDRSSPMSAQSTAAASRCCSASASSRSFPSASSRW